MPAVPDMASGRGHVGTRTTQVSRIDYITNKPYLRQLAEDAQSTNFGRLAAISS